MITVSLLLITDPETLYIDMNAGKKHLLDLS